MMDLGPNSWFAHGLPAEEGDPDVLDFLEDLLPMTAPWRNDGLINGRCFSFTADPGMLLTTLELSLIVDEHEDADRPVVGREH